MDKAIALSVPLPSPGLSEKKYNCLYYICITKSSEKCVNCGFSWAAGHRPTIKQGRKKRPRRATYEGKHFQRLRLPDIVGLVATPEKRVFFGQSLGGTRCERAYRWLPEQP